MVNGCIRQQPAFGHYLGGWCKPVIFRIEREDGNRKSGKTFTFSRVGCHQDQTLKKSRIVIDRPCGAHSPQAVSRGNPPASFPFGSPHPFFNGKNCQIRRYFENHYPVSRCGSRCKGILVTVGIHQTAGPEHDTDIRAIIRRLHKDVPGIIGDNSTGEIRRTRKIGAAAKNSRSGTKKNQQPDQGKLHEKTILFGGGEVNVKK